MIRVKHKILKGKYNITDIFSDVNDDSLRGHEKNLFKRRFRLDVRKFVFSYTVINCWLIV